MFKRFVCQHSLLEEKRFWTDQQGWVGADSIGKRGWVGLILILVLLLFLVLLKYCYWKGIGKRRWVGGTHLGPSKSFVVAAGRGRTLNWHQSQPYPTLVLQYSTIPSTGMIPNLTLHSKMYFNICCTMFTMNFKMD